MFKSRIILAVLLGGGVLAGCKKEEAKPEAAPVTVPPVPSAPKVTAPAAPAVPAVPAIPAVPTKPAATATPAVPAPPTLSSPSSLEAPATPAVPAVPSTPPVTTTTPDSSAAAPEADAKKVLADFQSHLLAKKWDDCSADLKKLNGMRDKLSPQMKEAIDNAKTTLTTAKAANSLSIPGLGTPASSEPNK